ncbi:hypothetical protein O6H91_11G095700 [Diphasiastrum complanatum]|uniref:Uncharacterized protein n=2 Tax=Diphasiastrum complanatum TaxID=34168 RepID=A0ACC2CBS1_DIPCM|nr:hypothetical protein O6H91_11G094900 [Diphasiastrum complanatum]KAJ7539486.1 hypothetical protein O6H91_11G095700 [Diphasiastrum complanatum]
MRGAVLPTRPSRFESACLRSLLFSGDGSVRAVGDFGVAIPSTARTTRVARGWQFGGHDSNGCRRRGTWSKGPVFCQRMFVPGFGEKSPERKAADSLHNFFTFLAVKIVLAQLEDYNREAYEELMEFVDRTSLKDGDKFCAALMRESSRHKGLALRILEVRSVYAREDFEWDNLKSLSLKQLDKANTALMRQFIVETSNFE